MGSGGRDEPARVFTQAVAVAIKSEIFVLSGDIGFTRFNGAELIVADPAIGHFLLSFGDVEAPAGLGLDERKRQSPAVLPDAQDLLAIGSVVDRGQRGRRLVELLQVLGVLVSVARPEQRRAVLAENAVAEAWRLGFGGIDEVLHRCFRSRIGFLGAGRKRRGDQDGRCKNAADPHCHRRCPRPRTAINSPYPSPARMHEPGGTAINARPVSRSANARRSPATGRRSRTATPVGRRKRACNRQRRASPLPAPRSAPPAPSPRHRRCGRRCRRSDNSPDRRRAARAARYRA